MCPSLTFQSIVIISHLLKMNLMIIIYHYWQLFLPWLVLQGLQGTSGSSGEPGRDGNDVSTCINGSIIILNMAFFFMEKLIRGDLSPPLKRVPYNSRRAKLEGDITGAPNEDIVQNHLT